MIYITIRSPSYDSSAYIDKYNIQSREDADQIVKVTVLVEEVMDCFDQQSTNSDFKSRLI